MNNQIEYCCNAMKEQLTYECDHHPDLTCPDIIITRSDTFPVGWGGSPVVGVKVSPHYTLRGRNADYRAEFCPWCGTDLNYKAYRKDVEALFAKEVEGCPPQNGKQKEQPEAG
jgi:hypothetical protein